MYFIKIGTRNTLICFIALIFLSGFEGEKDLSYFLNNKEEAENYIKEKCDNQPPDQNKESISKTCKAAQEAANKLNDANELNTIIQEAFEPPKTRPPVENEEQQEGLTEEQQRALFNKYPAKAEALMETKCNELFEKPDYSTNKDIQDEECDIAKEELEKLKKIASEEKSKNLSEKNLEYYKNNIIEARQHSKDCKAKNNNSISCQYASIAIREYEEAKKTRESLTKLYSGSILAAQDMVNKCQNELENDPIKCETAFKVYNQSVKQSQSEHKFQKFLIKFRNNLGEAKELAKTICKSFSNSQTSKNIFLENDECNAARKAIQEQQNKDNKLELLKILKRYKEYFTLNIAKENNFNPSRYKALIDYFSQDYKLAEDFVASCIKNKTRSKVSALDCLAATNVIRELLESAKKHEEEKEKAQNEYKNYYRKFFTKNPNKANELLQGRCKVVFSNQWYHYDENLKDEECEAALAQQKRLNKIKKQKEMEKLIEQRKDESYFLDNLEMTNKIAQECINGTIKDLKDCEMSLKALKTAEENKNQRIKYKKYYKNHKLAAQYKLKWCKANMTKFDTHCYVVYDTLKNHEDKVINKEKYESLLEEFEQNPFEANLLLLGKCADLIKDNWYFLDVNMQTEECNAAYEVIKGYN